MQTILVRRFTTSDQITHFSNALAWFALSLSGISIGAALRAGIDPSRAVLGTHFLAGFALCAVLLSYVLFSKARFARMLHELLRRDRPFLDWLKCFGGYPEKLLGRKPKTRSVPPQGRYNAGQRIAYSALLLINLTLLASGLALFLLHNPTTEPCTFYELMRMTHSVAFGIGILILAAHVPMGFVSTDSLRAIFRFGRGYLTKTALTKTAALWVSEDLEVEKRESTRTILREKAL